MNDLLSLWRSPLDKVALAEAEALRDRQPQCTTIPYNTDFDPITVYNFGYYGAVDGGSQATNDTALTNMFTAMSGASRVGGAALIEQFKYPVYANNFAVPDQCNLIGMGGGGTGNSGASDFFHFVISDPLGAMAASTFFNCTGGHTDGGKYFRSLAFEWNSPAYVGDTCIYADTWNCRAINCTFNDCPVAFNAQGLSCTLEQCTVNYTVTATAGPNNATAVILAGPQCAVIGPGEFLQTSQTSSKGGPTGCTCIAVQGPCEHGVIHNLHISDWTTGIDFSQKANSRYTTISNVESQSWKTCINIQLPASANNPIWGIKVADCTLAISQDSTTAGPVILIDTNTGNNNNMLNDIEISNCTVTSIQNGGIQPNNAYGLQVNGGSNIKVVGGTFSNFSPTGGAGIAITGAVGNTQIIGCNLRPNYPNAPHSYSQQYAVLVSGSPADTIIVDSCDMGGYSASPVSVTGTIASDSLFINNCHGYNDQNTALNGGVAPTSSTSAATSSKPYYGPSVFTFSNSTAVTLHVFGQAFSMSFGIIFLPSPYDAFYFSSAPSSFSWIGK